MGLVFGTKEGEGVKDSSGQQSLTRGFDVNSPISDFRFPISDSRFPDALITHDNDNEKP